MRRLRPPSHDGTAPARLLPLKSRCLRLVRDDSEGGMIPLSPFPLSALPKRVSKTLARHHNDSQLRQRCEVAKRRRQGASQAQVELVVQISASRVRTKRTKATKRSSTHKVTTSPLTQTTPQNEQRFDATPGTKNNVKRSGSGTATQFVGHAPDAAAAHAWLQLATHLTHGVHDGPPVLLYTSPSAAHATGLLATVTEAQPGSPSLSAVQQLNDGWLCSSARLEASAAACVCTKTNTRSRRMSTEAAWCEKNR